MKNLSMDNQSPDPHLNSGPPKYDCQFVHIAQDHNLLDHHYTISSLLSTHLWIKF
jgi:hypothetical protein